MICPKCGHKTDGSRKICPYCGFSFQSDDVFTWSELPPMPVLNKRSSDSNEDKNGGSKGFFSKRTKTNILRTLTVFTEICILAGVISGIYVWKSKNTVPISSDAQNIVYSSEDIVMMLVRNRNEWLLEQPENGFSACCFLDMDFDGSPELVSAAYDSDSCITKARVFRVRNCTLENIPINYSEDEGFFDIAQQLSLCYSPDTKEMLYISADSRQTETESITILGSFYMHENQIFRENILSESLTNGVYSYAYYDDEQSLHEITRKEFLNKQSETSGKLSDLNLGFEWVSGSELQTVSTQKLAALLLRSYDSFGYDSSGLALQ
ncbi:MAG: hypothetical protein ACI4JN_02925 [Ruminococcus sp.]